MKNSTWLNVLPMVLCLVLGCSRGPSAGDDKKMNVDPADGSDGGASGASNNDGDDDGSGGGGSGEDTGASNVGDGQGNGGGASAGNAAGGNEGPPVDLDDCKKAPDFDKDVLRGKCDNCPTRANSGQEDADADGVGDACDGCDNLMDLTCSTDRMLTLPYGGEILIIGVPFEVETSKHAHFEELARPMCMPDKKLALLRTYSFTDAPLAGQNAKESWIDLRSDQYGVEGWQNEGIFIPQAFRYFYEPTAVVGGWKKQYVTDTLWEETPKGWRATNMVGDQLFWQLEFTRGDFEGTHPAYVTQYARNPQDFVQNPDPSYILSPHELPPTSYATTDPVVFDSTWTPNGAVAKTKELGMVKITWNKPDLPAGMVLDLRWMDLLPPSGTELPGHLVHSVPSPETKDQEFLHKARGYGECSVLRP